MLIGLQVCKNGPALPGYIRLLNFQRLELVLPLHPVRLPVFPTEYHTGPIRYRRP